MALSRRTGARFQASIWPGFVDAMTGLLLVLMFVLTIFMAVQFALRETITGQASKLDELSAEVDALAQALGLERDRNATLSDRVGELTVTLGDARARQEEQAALIASLRSQTEEQAADVRAILDSLGVRETTPQIEVWNKIDRLDPDARQAVLTRAARSENVQALSAVT